MSDELKLHEQGGVKPVLPDVASDLCERALEDAKGQLHPLLQTVEPYRLAHRREFLHNFRSALERRIARKLVSWQPGIQAIFRYDEAGMPAMKPWDGSIHLLVRLPCISSVLRTLSKKLDKHLVNHLRQMGWPVVQTRQSILEVHQVTPRELRYGIGYGAMFFAVHNVPSKVWPKDRPAR